MIEVQFSVRGNDFSYGNELEGVIGITNRSAEPLVITADGLFQGNFRVSARVAGDIKKDIPDLLSQTIRTDMIVLPGRSLIETVKLSVGELRNVLMTYPQASLDLQFTLYVDPVATPGGAISNRLVDVKPVTISIKRPAVDDHGRLRAKPLQHHLLGTGRAEDSDGPAVRWTAERAARHGGTWDALSVSV